ncbi:MAG: GMP/IMP nucleotidase [Candidatus Thiosymbion ectosymbiont of Robbea hypermnestra]|nr:GMP/IMP nucleotidase [Candidatus Thiosymbion ectosymbiont of Robbea hypermnestra]
MIDWNVVDTVFLDLDGTLLDLHFDNYFWREHVPRRYAAARGLSLAGAWAELETRYRAHEGTLAWYCVEHWSRELGLDIARLKREVAHLIAMHPRVTDFLEALAALGKRRVLVTNAHHKSLALKMEKTLLAEHLEQIICSHDLGVPKESADFWPRLQAIEPFDRERTLFVDDNPRMLQTAKSYGFRWLLAVLSPDSKAPAQKPGEFPAVRYCADLLPELSA